MSNQVIKSEQIVLLSLGIGILTFLSFLTMSYIIKDMKIVEVNEQDAVCENPLYKNDPLVDTNVSTASEGVDPKEKDDNKEDEFHDAQESLNIEATGGDYENVLYYDTIQSLDRIEYTLSGENLKNLNIKNLQALGNILSANIMNKKLTIENEIRDLKEKAINKINKDQEESSQEIQAITDSASSIQTALLDILTFRSNTLEILKISPEQIKEILLLAQNKQYEEIKNIKDNLKSENKNNNVSDLKKMINNVFIEMPNEKIINNFKEHYQNLPLDLFSIDKDLKIFKIGEENFKKILNSNNKENALSEIENYIENSLRSVKELKKLFDENLGVSNPKDKLQENIIKFINDFYDTKELIEKNNPFQEEGSPSPRFLIDGAQIVSENNLQTKI
jgi:hypothetical protein